MTGFTFGFSMLTEQIEFRIAAMIEGYVRPIVVPVAVIALRAVQAVMLVVFKMTGDTFGFERSFENVVDMTFVACDLPVPAE